MGAIKNIYPSSTEHYAAIHPRKYKTQSDIYMGAVTNKFKDIGHAQRYSTQELFEAMSSGQCVLLANYEVVNRTNDYKGDMRFISASAFTIDIDDVEEMTNPKRVLYDLKYLCAGLFYTFSHGKEEKGNRYRLVFQLDQSITDEKEYNMLVEYMMDYLKRLGLPVDESPKSPTQVIRPGISGYEINDFSIALLTKKWLSEAKEQEEHKQREREAEQKERAKQFRHDIYKPITFEELKEMCEAIGYIPSGGTIETWKRMCLILKHQVITGNLTNEQGYELYCIISGNEAQERTWNGFKPRGDVKIGTLIAYAIKEAGYKRKHVYNYALNNTPESIPTELIKVNKYLPTEVAKDLIQRKQRLIVHSPTGSGKTTSFVNAFKESASEDWSKVKDNKNFHYYIFSAPTIPLTEQVAKNHHIFCAMGGMKNLRNKITHEAVTGCRYFVCTYDKTKEIVDCLTDGLDYEGEKPTFTIVIDEIHKFTEAYNYRFRAIDQLEQLINIATSFIGLSGTPEDILKDGFDKLIKIDNGINKSPCLNYKVFMYEKKKDADIMLIPVIQALLSQTRVLLFINRKERIERIRDILRKQGIKTQTVTSDSKHSPTYKNIIENAHIDDDVQVLITTTVLADGVNIENGDDEKWTCLVVADEAAPIFNPSTIKQISNRFRGDYKYFGLYIHQPNPKYKEIHRFNIESEYQYRKKIVSGYVNYLNEEFKKEYLQEFIPSLVEKNNGIFHKSQDEKAMIEFNPLFVRHQSMKRKEDYYKLFRNAFIQEVGRQIGVTCSGIFNMNEIVKKKGVDVSSILELIEGQQAQAKKENDELRAAFSTFFDEQMYECFQMKDEQSLEGFKTQVHPDQYSSVMKNYKIADFETCKKVGQGVKRKADINTYSNDIKALVDLALFDHVKKSNVTKKVFMELLKLANEKQVSADFKEFTEKKLVKKLKVQLKDIKTALQLFHTISSRSNSHNYTTIQPLTVELVANRHGIDQAAIKNSVIQYVVQQRNEKQVQIMLSAIYEKWGIESLKNDAIL